jgi:CHAT domain-containing protein
MRPSHRLLTPLMVALLASCTAPAYRMGDPIRTNPQVAAKGSPEVAAAPAPASEYRNERAREKADEWELKWQQIQSTSDTVSWSDHFQVCGLKYRLRNYDQLFHCLDLLDAKIVAGGARVPKADLVQRGAPPMIEWIRASAYAELGEPEIALKWAESAWAALPPAFRTADNSITRMHAFGGVDADLWPVFYVGGALGSAGSGIEDSSISEGMLREGRNNPAALDLRPPVLTMSLAVQRSLLYQRLGQDDKARAAFADLRRWENNRYVVNDSFGIPGLHSTSNLRPWRGKAQLLSIGPLFAQGDYQRVTFIYEQLSLRVTSMRQSDSIKKATGWTILSGQFIESLMTRSDARLFTLAVEDVSNALLYAQSLSRLGRRDQARAMLDTLLAMPEIRAMGNLYWVTLYERAQIAREDGQRAQAIQFLRQSVDAIESVRSTISFEAAKIGFAGDKQTVYAALIAALTEEGDWQQAFLYTERAKARALVDLLAQRRDLGPPDTADEKVRALFAHASTVESSAGSVNEAETVRGIQLVADAREQLSNAAPEAASLISVQRVEVPDIVSRMAPQETLVDYYLQGEDLYVFVLSGRSIKGLRLPAKGLEAEVRAFRGAIDQRNPQATDLGRGLYARLIGPVRADLQGSRLVIAPHGVLHYLPFAALSDGQRYLVDQFSVRLIPSADTLVYLRPQQTKKPGRLLALGNPDLGSRALDLPNAQTEALKVAAMFPDSRALVRADASKSAVKELGNGFLMLHFATHGRFDAASPLSSGLYLAKGGEPDGVLTVSDLYSLRWDVDLVTLSACETGLGKVSNGDDVIGLTRGFLYAGARSIVASLWEVDDAATAQLMESFYGNLQTHDKREALRLAQIETRRRYPEPWFWAAFNIVGSAE